MSEPTQQNRPIVSVVVRQKKNPDTDELQRALSDLAQQDPAIKISAGAAEGEAVISGMSDLHLESVCDRIAHEYEVELDVSEPTVIYLETIRTQADAEGKFIRRHNYAHVKLRLEPREPGSGYEFVAEVTSGAVPSQFLESVNRGIRAAMEGGVLVGHEMVDLRAVLYDGSYHAEDSNEMAFQIAASMAFKEAARKARPVVIEPVISADIVIPEVFMSAIINDLNSRRGRILGMEHRAGLQVIHADVPLAEMLGYAKHLQLSTQRRAEVSMSFLRYEDAPRRNGSRGDEAGVTANTPKGPKAGTDSAAAELDT